MPGRDAERKQPGAWAVAVAAKATAVLRVGCHYVHPDTTALAMLPRQRWWSLKNPLTAGRAILVVLPRTHTQVLRYLLVLAAKSKNHTVGSHSSILSADSDLVEVKMAHFVVL